MNKYGFQIHFSEGPNCIAFAFSFLLRIHWLGDKRYLSLSKLYSKKATKDEG